MQLLLEQDSPLMRPNPNDLVDAMAQIEGADLVGDKQLSTRGEVLQFCQTHPNTLHRACLAGHLTASSLVVNHQRSHLLVIHHTKLRRWLQPGGHADGNGNLRRVAWDEATEETGIQNLRLVSPAIDIDIHTIPPRANDPEHLHLDLRFLLLAPDDAQIVTNHESTDFCWVHAQSERIAEEPDLIRAVDRALDVARRMPASLSSAVGRLGV